MEHRFVIKDKEVLYSFNKFEDIPEVFDHLIEFLPYMPPPPHTHEEHEEIDSWMPRFQDILNRQRFK